MTSPLVTVLLSTYKQEPFVRDAVRSVLAQDYRPLQIVISDDASPDRTFDILGEEVGRYSGPHDVQLRRNATRQRSVRHLEDAMTLARGALVVMAHGDDISLPQRVSVLVETWQRERVSMVSSNAVSIDREGNRHAPTGAGAKARRIPALEISSEAWLWEMLGATLAMEPEVLRGFEPLAHRLPVGLDHVLPLRAAVLKGLYYVEEPLVLYRRHGQNMSNSVVDRRAESRPAFQETDMAAQIAIHTQWLEDMSAVHAARPDDPMLRELRLQLVDRLYQELCRWSRHRTQLRAEGKVPVWLDEAEALARPVRFPLEIDRKIAAAAAAPESGAPPAQTRTST